MKKLIVMCGISRCGKSTWVKNHKEGKVVVSADDLRHLVYNKDFWSQGEPLVWSIREIMLRDLMQQGLDIIIDETNTMVRSRKPIIKLAKYYGYTTECCVFTTDVEKCKGRALVNLQNHLVPVIEKMAKQFQPPTLDEGFDTITWL